MKQDSSSIHSETRLAMDSPIPFVQIDTLAWVTISIALLLIYLYPGFAPGLGSDSFQYLSVAQNALDGRLAYTSLVHFDAERSFGVIPAPMVTFPPGYPFMLALVSLAGPPLSQAGLLVSAASTVACVPLLAWISEGIGLSRPLRNVVIAGFVVNGIVIRLGTGVGTDALFMCLVLLGVALIVSARGQAEERSALRWLAAGAAFGMAYVVRYAGMFFIVGLALLVVWHWVSSERDLARRFALAFAVAGVAVLIGVTRNITLVGNWRGGNDKIVSNPLSSVLMETARGANRLFLGPGTGTAGGTFVPRAALALLFALGVLWMIRSLLRRRAVANEARAHVGPTGVWLDLLVLAVAYVGCLFYAGLKSVIAYGDGRYFAPVLPLLMLLLGLALQPALKATPQGSARRKISVTVLATSVCLYAFLNLLVLTESHRAGWSFVAGALDSRSGEGKSPRALIQELVGQSGVVIANNGQTIGHLLARPTISLVGPHFSSLEWNEKAILDTVRQFGAKAIVIYVPVAGQWDDTDYVPSPFVRTLAQGGDAPPWMRLAYRGDNVIVYSLHPEDRQTTE